MKDDKKGIVNIHGKEYMTVARRIELAHEDKAIEKFNTKVISHNPVVVKATILVKGVEYTGISSVDLQSSRMIEKQNPYEVAETSAVGRALGFAGYGLIESIASADEMMKPRVREENGFTYESTGQEEPPMPDKEFNPPHKVCQICGEPAEQRSGVKNGKSWKGVFCSTKDRTHTLWI